MGRDVTGLRLANKPSSVKANGAVIPNDNLGVSEGTDSKKLSTPSSKATGAENTQEHPTSPETVPSEGTPALESIGAENTQEHLTSSETVPFVSEGADNKKLSTPTPKPPGADNKKLSTPTPKSPGADNKKLSTPTPKPPGADNKKLSTPTPKSPGAENKKLSTPTPKSPGAENKKLSTPTPKSPGAENNQEHLTSPKTGSNGTENVDSEHLMSPKTPANGTENVNSTPFPTKDSESNSPMSHLMPRKHPDEEDDWSASSSTAGSGRTARSRVTIGTAPTFRSAERAEKRREFYQKLEEKHQALEAERSQAEARTKEEQEAALKKLRKNLVVKAKPVPSFYYEAPPPKTELKKLPLTRPKSPNLTRRKSCGDVVHLSPDEKAKLCRRTQRSSLGTHMERSGTANEVKSKSRMSGESGNGGGKLKGRAKHVKDTTKSSPTKLGEQNNANITVQS